MNRSSPRLPESSRSSNHRRAFSPSSSAAEAGAFKKENKKTKKNLLSPLFPVFSRSCALVLDPPP